jgi:hypothetical protein
LTKSHGRFSEKDETFHQFDPHDWLWNESWFFSWIDLEGGPVGFFRIGVLPNQQRAMLWNFVYTGDYGSAVRSRDLHSATSTCPLASPMRSGA